MACFVPLKWRNTRLYRATKPGHAPPPSPPSELERLLALIPADQTGLGIEAIARRLHEPLPRRTLQRRLALLVAQGRTSRRGEAIAVLVHDDGAATAAQVKARVPRSVAVSDRAAFIRLVLTELESLHPCNAIRSGLRPLEFADWKECHAPVHARPRRP